MKLNLINYISRPMNDSENNQIIENLKTICLCKNVKRGSIFKAVKDGCDSLKKVNKKLGTGSGNCKGERCQGKIADLIKDSH